MDITVVVQQMVIVFLIMMTGYILLKRGIVKKEASREISAVIVNLCSPAMMLMSVWDNDTEISLESLIATAIIGVILYVVLMILGILMPRIVGAKGITVNQYNMMTIFGNIGFIGIPVVSAVIGSAGVIYLLIMNILYNLLIYSYGIYLVSHADEKAEIQFHPWSVINVGTISCVLSIVLYLWNPSLPVILTDTVTYIGRSTTFLSVFVIGINLARIPLKTLFGSGRVYKFVVLRQIVIPVILGLILRQFIQNEIMLSTLIMALAVPVGNMPMMFFEEAGLDTGEMSLGIVATTLFSVVTIPLTVFLTSL